MVDFIHPNEPVLCLWCDRIATRWCDAALGLVDGGSYKPKGKPRFRVTTMDAMLSGSYTCDAPFCADHGHKVGHMCAGKHSDTIDHCQHHATDGFDRSRLALLSLEEIAELRTNLHAGIRRERIVAVEGDDS